MAGRRVATPNGSGWLKAINPRAVLRGLLAVVLILVTMSLLPGPLESPPGASGERPGSYRLGFNTSVIGLFLSPFEGETGGTLSWSWQISDGESSARFYATVRSEEAHGSVIFGGPISHLVDNCHINGEPTTPSPSISESLGFEPPDTAFVWFTRFQADHMSHIDFEPRPGRPAENIPGGNIIYCDVRDFASDSPPLHRLYTPTMVAYAKGSETATNEELVNDTVCVEVPWDSATEGRKECLDEVDVSPSLGDSDELVDLPHEEGIRDANLLVIGAIAGAAAALVLDGLAGMLHAGTSNLIPALRAVKTRLRRVTPYP